MIEISILVLHLPLHGYVFLGCVGEADVRGG